MAMSQEGSRGKPSASVSTRMPGRSADSGSTETARPRARRHRRHRAPARIERAVRPPGGVERFERLETPAAGVLAERERQRRLLMDAMARRRDPQKRLAAHHLGAEAIFAGASVMIARSRSFERMHSISIEVGWQSTSPRPGIGAGRSAPGFPAGSGRHNRPACRAGCGRSVRPRRRRRPSRR